MLFLAIIFAAAIAFGYTYFLMRILDSDKPYNKKNWWE